MNNQKKAIAFIIVFLSALCMFLFVYTLIRLSFQEGDSSSRMTQAVVKRIGEAVFDEELTASQVDALNLFLRSTAHFVLFSMLSFGLCTVAFLVFSRPAGRILGLIFNMFICVVLAYGTEYFKQFIDGRHFQLEDAWLNIYGVVLGLCSFMITGLIFWAIGIRTRSGRNDGE